MVNFLKALLGLKKEEKRLKNPMSGVGGYDYIIEIRSILEKYKLKSLIKELRPFHGFRLHRVPHITLVYDFKPKVEDYRIIQVVAQIAKNYNKDNLLDFFYDGIEVKKGKKGYILALKITPSKELKCFREEIYKALKPIIVQSPDVEKYNENLWYHAALSFHSLKNPEEIVPKEKLAKLGNFLFKGTVIRITLVYKGKIRYEYDTLIRDILSRPEALSKDKLVTTYSAYRERVFKVGFRRTELDNVWVTSDHHFGHANIIKYSARPFMSVKEMDEFLINKWNEVVSSDDKVYVVGDFTFSNPKRYLEKLKGKKILIQGTHDPPGVGPENLEINYGHYKFLLSHYPLNVNEWNIHGHIHNNNLREYPFLNHQTKKINVGVDLTNFYPVSFKRVIELIESNRNYLYLP
jgi:calcineurin-like phosphoesterase family protein/predicted DNA-binding transcriptional regulator